MADQMRKPGFAVHNAYLALQYAICGCRNLVRPLDSQAGKVGSNLLKALWESAFGDGNSGPDGRIA
jgi:hypothetical protein